MDLYALAPPSAGAQVVLFGVAFLVFLAAFVIGARATPRAWNWIALGLALVDLVWLWTALAAA